MCPAVNLSDQITKLLREHADDGMRKCDLRRSLDLRGRDGLAEFRSVFRSLADSGVIVRRNRGRYVLSRSEALVPGVLTAHRSGFGFVAPDEGTLDIFIPPRHRGVGLSGDRVLVRILDDTGERGPVGAITKITQRRHSLVTGKLVDSRQGFAIRPLRRDLPPLIVLQEFDLDMPVFAGTSPGDWVVGQLLPHESPADPLRASFVRRVGGSSVEGDLDAIVAEYGLEPPYSEAENRAAAELEPAAVERRDRTDLAVITIDPSDAKDFDDGISLEESGNAGTVVIGVHIADVAVYVPAGSRFDEQARLRAFTAYLPGRTLPMLPDVLASDRCSLLEGQTRPAHSAYLEINEADGRLVRAWREWSQVRITNRLTFEDVADVLEGADDPDISGELNLLVRRLGKVAEAVRSRRREQEAFLEVAAADMRVICEGDPARVVDVQRVTPNAGHELVEEFMLAANVAVAEEMARRDIPALYRVHDEPKQTDVNDFRQWAMKVLKKKVPNLRDRASLNRFLSGLDHSGMRDVVISSFLSVLQRAVYSPAPGSHYGLGKECYGHFTSPIRRYADLVVHQQLLAADHGSAVRSEDDCARVAGHCSERGRNNDAAYYGALDRLKMRYVRDLCEGEAAPFFEGIVARVVSDGVVVYVPDLGLYGRIARDRLGRSRYRKNAGPATMKDDTSGKVYGCGDIVFVEVRRADTVTGTLELRPFQSRA